MDLYGVLKERKMLLIDDDEWVRDSLSKFFECKGCCLTALETAEEGLRELRDQPYDIIIFDYKLPGIDGIEFIKRVQRSHPLAIKILITAYGSKGLASEADRMGIDGFIEKPFNAMVLEKFLTGLIEKRG
ncbi:MAG: response regulator [Deltaproteobacteria bacterium]|nr:response regulator [Deltaproteobacteria bacterium]